MSKFLIIEEDRDKKLSIYNFAVISAENEEEAESKYLDNVDVDLDKTDLNFFDLDSIESDFFYYLEVDLDKAR